jgi:hypothetical protein
MSYMVSSRPFWAAVIVFLKKGNEKRPWVAQLAMCLPSKARDPEFNPLTTKTKTKQQPKKNNNPCIWGKAVEISYIFQPIYNI